MRVMRVQTVRVHERKLKGYQRVTKGLLTQIPTGLLGNDDKTNGMSDCNSTMTG